MGWIIFVNIIIGIGFAFAILLILGWSISEGIKALFASEKRKRAIIAAVVLSWVGLWVYLVSMSYQVY